MTNIISTLETDSMTEAVYMAKAEIITGKIITLEAGTISEMITVKFNIIEVIEVSLRKRTGNMTQ